MSDDQADVIVVGAGSAGSVVARRLADAGLRVLVVEAGPHREAPEVDDPARMHELWNSPLDWGFRTVPQEHAHGRSLHLPRGHVVGGSHALNAMIWVRGNPADYDRWAALGNPGWSWEDVRPVFERIDGLGTGGPGVLDVLTGYRPDPVQCSIVEAAQEAGLPFNPDYNQGASQDGVSFMQFTIRGHTRLTTARAYLEPVLGKGVTLVPDARARRLLLEGRRCVGVEWTRGGRLERARADQVVLCGGAIGSPVLLLRSGIGDADALGGAAVHLPGVGRNLQDHWLVPVIASTDRAPTLSRGLPHTQSHLFWRSGPGLEVPDLQPLHFGVPLYEPWMHGPPDGLSLMAGLVRPESKGEIRLSDGAEPLIDPRVLSADADLDALCAAVRLCQEIIAAPALREGWGTRELYPGPLAVDEAGLRDYVRESVVTYHHQAGTCKMGVDDEAVVDPELRVHGVEGLRVADASIMPDVTTGNTNAPAIMIGERAADLILGGVRTPG
ncbi:GMC family oxidoreductase [Actinomadura sp. NEAU-AAG7]|uniref:GMC family oxidoreductase n=1 Tax=Actinomadura sp. NEAU-AAG7 TaxID=2839640 RepID=UPI001BE3F479|nr:GMC family oxidoreductase N-terminal domain-containing protein [Actinomadura sp. NEAU-AAG7]MBT2211086.1 GMC family oxidoreductase N-terminal domain-containing protein [Actinomadura sp. NEAU-AAG7]